VDLSARGLMKNAAKCDNHAESQIPAKHQGFERILRCPVRWSARTTQCQL